LNAPRNLLRSGKWELIETEEGKGEYYNYSMFESFVITLKGIWVVWWNQVYKKYITLEKMIPCRRASGLPKEEALSK
jgi:hypothetical protein